MVPVMILSLIALLGFVLTCYSLKEGRSMYKHHHGSRSVRKLEHNPPN